MMEKIEKLKIPDVRHQIGLREADGSNLIELKMVGEKINEVIDRLNEQPEVIGKRKRLEDLTDEELKERRITKTQDTLGKIKEVYNLLQEDRITPSGRKVLKKLAKEMTENIIAEETTKEDKEYLEKEREKELQQGIAWVKQREQDTPEGLIKRKLKEITTSERVGFLYAVGDDDLLAGELYDYIQQLLEEREKVWYAKGWENSRLWALLGGEYTKDKEDGTKQTKKIK